ncbi:MAG: replication initiation protein [Nitrospirota bacterium]|nr:replication initiation protein [Nitrospirota bacterium]
MTKSTNNLELFSDTEIREIQPTGSPWYITKHDPATLPVPLQTVLMKVDGAYTEKDRKLWLFLLHVAFDKLAETPIHSVSVADVNNIFKQVGGDKGSKWIWESARRLARTVVEWEYALGDERFQGVASIFAASLNTKSGKDGTLHYSFPQNLIPILLRPNRFARLRVHFIMKLSGKYAVTLYEILEGFVNRKDKQCNVKIEDLRKWLKVPEGSYKDWKDFKKWVLNPAIKQINDAPEDAGFSVSYEAKRKGRSYNRVIFTLEQTLRRKQKDYKIKRTIESGRAFEAGRLHNRPILLQNVIDDIWYELQCNLDRKSIEEQFWNHWEMQGCPSFDKGVIPVFKGFVRRKMGQDKDRKRPID